MTPRFASCGVVILLVALVGCQKRAEAPSAATPPPPPPKPVVVELVKESERSRSFLAVNQHLELGGTLYGYVDVEGDALKIAESLHEVAGTVAKFQPQLAPLAQQDLGVIFTALGLTDIKAIGFSSVPDGTGFFRNQAFIYTPGERHGLLLGLGGKPGPFTHLNLAPADAAFYGEAEFDLPVVYRTIKDVVAKVGGEQAGNQFEQALKKAGESAALSVLDLIYGLKGHSALVVRIDPNKTITLPPPQSIKLPAFSVLICVDGVGPVIEPSLAKLPMLKRTEVGTTHVYSLTQALPIQEIQPVLVVDGTTLYFATSQAFLDECRQQQSGLGQTPEFQKAMSSLGTQGNGLAYVHPRLFEGLRKVVTLNPNLPPQIATTISSVVTKLPQTDRPMVALRTNLPDGILIRSYWNRSMKQELAAVALYPVTVGALSAMAIPAFQKVRASSQEKAVMNNLRQLSAAADQYYLETGKRSVTFGELVGPGKFIKELPSVRGEDYSTILFIQGRPLRIRLPDGRVLHFDN